VGRSRGGGGAARAFSLGGVCEAGHKVSCRWRERTLSESRERVVPVSAAPSTERCTSGDPVGSVSLFYPLMENGVPMEPARYYPNAQVACWSWSLASSGCSEVQQLPATWSRTGVLTSFTAEPTTLKSLSHGVASYTVPSNGSVAIELALRRTSLARRVPPSGCLWRLTATWQGPASATRPRSLCLRAKGLSARGRLYPISPAIMTML
jgi:hypothetical protein